MAASERDRETGREGVGFPLQSTSESTSAMSSGPSSQALERQKSAMSTDAPLIRHRPPRPRYRTGGIEAHQPTVAFQHCVDIGDSCPARIHSSRHSSTDQLRLPPPTRHVA